MRVQSSYGLAVDLGTSYITANLIDCSTGRIVQNRVVKNPLVLRAPEVVTLASIASRDISAMTTITRVLRQTVSELSLQILNDLDLSPSSVSDVVFVGNSVLHSLFHGLPVDSLTRSPFRLPPSHKNAIVTSATDIGLELPHAVCYSPPLIESFVGSDAVADIVAAELTQSNPPSLLIDIGTNTEVVLHVKDSLLVTSAASGPAFESMSLEFGMMAEPGAIYSVQISEDLTPSVRVIGGGHPYGICGTGAISAVSEMLRVGLINPLGSFNRELKSPHILRNGATLSYVLYCDKMFSSDMSTIRITQIDIRMIQQSKAAIAASIGTLLRTAGISVDDLSSVLLTGAFGESIDVESTTKIGMLPKFSVRPIQQRGAAVQGAGMILLNRSVREMAEQVAHTAQYVDLMNSPLFDTLYESARIFQEFRI